MRGIVFRQGSTDGEIAERTVRSLREAGVAEIERVRDFRSLGRALQEVCEPLALFAAGAWLCGEGRLPAIPPSATGRALIGIGAVREHAVGKRNEQSGAGGDALARMVSGGFARRRWWERRRGQDRFPEVCSLYVEAPAAQALGAWLEEGASWTEAVERALRTARFRAVHLPVLDVYFDPELRIVQLVTTIQIGGAERVALDLAAEQRNRGLAVCVAVFGKPTRLAFPAPPIFADLSGIADDPEKRAEEVARLCRGFGADLAHAHLIKTRDAEAIRARGLPLVMTLHNMPQAWPAGLAEKGAVAADLLLACSKAVATAARSQLSGVPIRTVWNGIHAASVAPSPERAAEGRRLRQELGMEAGDFVLAAVANPRRQKRLERLPGIVALLQQRLGLRRVRLLMAGAPGGGGADAQDAMAAFGEAVAGTGTNGSVHWTGATLEVGGILAASDVLISVSDFEGLSLAQLEGLAAGLPVVATDVGGTAEIAAENPAMRLLPAGASNEEIVGVLQKLADSLVKREAGLSKSFIRSRMARRCLFFYAQAIRRAARERPARGGKGLWLICNNFSTGGAQSSARRLLEALAGRGIAVRAAVVQERPEFPTAGRAALLKAGIPVLAIPPPETLEPEEAVSALIRAIQDDPPKSIVFWNLLSSYKLLLADGLLEETIYDVSPGEMYFESLRACFANPRSGLPCRSALEYGQGLAGVVVKYAAEAREAEAMLGAPTQVIRNGVAIRPEADRRARDGERLILGAAARLSPQKRLEDLLEAVGLAAPRLPPFVLRIAGGAETGQEDYAKALRQQAQGLPVEWVGELADTAGFLSELDIFLMISEPAGCPNASLEAMAAGLPVVATDVGGASEQVLDGVTGRLVPRRDGAAFAEALVMLGTQPELRQVMGEEAREYVRREFSLEAMTRNYAKLLGLEI